MYDIESNIFTHIFMFCGFSSFVNLAKDWLNQLYDAYNKSRFLTDFTKGNTSMFELGTVDQ